MKRRTETLNNLKLQPFRMSDVDYMLKNNQRGLLIELQIYAAHVCWGQRIMF